MFIVQDPEVDHNFLTDLLSFFKLGSFIILTNLSQYSDTA
jgi:hypothetical protein